MKTDEKVFNCLDKAFWMAWGALPFIAALRIYYLFTSDYFNVDDNICSEVSIMHFSLAGKILTSAALCLNIVLYVALLAYMHTLTRQFRRGTLFVDGTLKYMQRIALLMVAWPFIKIISLSLTSYALFALGDVNEWNIKFNLDLPLISAGLVILALRLVMSHAIKLHHDAQYTV